MNGAQESPSSQALRLAFEEGSLPVLSHADHVHLAYLYLVEGELLTVLDELPARLKRFVALRGASEKYHATLTWSWILLVHERMRSGPESSWSRFHQRHPDLLDPARILDHYTERELDAPDARRNFVLPRR